MRKGLTTLMVILLAVGALLVSCNANVEAPADELVTISFDNESSRALSSNLETFTPGAYYWKYAAKKADSSNLISGQTADYDSDPESGALWIKEGEPGFGETSGEVYTPFKVQGFSQGLWNFRLFGYKKVIGDNPATTEVVETEYYLLAYSGETTGVLLKQNGTNLVKAIVSPTQTGNGTLVVKITGSDKITLDPATPGLIPNTKIKLKVEKITSTATTTEFEDFVTEDYNASLEAGTYKVTVKFTNDDASVEFASGSVVSTVYANLTTTVKGNLTEIITSAIFGAEQNPDIITTSIGTASITQGTTASSVNFTSTTETKVAATMPTAAAKSLIAAMEEELDAKTSSSTSQTSDLTLNLSVNTTEATETTVTYEIGMEATLIYEKKDAQASQKTTTKSTVETLDDFVTVVIDLRANLQDVSVTHSGTVMTECESLDILNGKTKAQDTTGIGFYFYDSTSGKLYIKTWKFSPFQLSYTVPSYVAAIGAARYKTLAAAIAAVPTDGTETTITIIKDSVIPGNAGVTIAATQSIILDLNGFTVKNAVNQDATSQVIANNGKLVIKDSSASGTGALKNSMDPGTNGGQWYERNYVTTIINNFGDLTIESGKIQNTAVGSICFAIDSNSNTSNVKLTVNGGYISSVGTGIRLFCNSETNENSLTIHGGTIVSEGDDAVWVQLPGSNPSSMKRASVLIDGGTITGESASFNDRSWGDGWDNVHYVVKGGSFVGAVISDKEGNKFITGGTFDADPSLYVAPGYYSYKDGSWYVVAPVVIPYEEKGTKEDPFIINSVEDFLKIDTLSDAMKAGNKFYFKLTNDIDLRDVPFSSDYAVNCIAGGIDGKKDETESYKIYAPNDTDVNKLFGYMRDVEISNIDIILDERRVSLVGGAYEGETFIIDNVDFSSTDFGGRVYQLAHNGSLYFSYNYLYGRSDWGGNYTLKNCDVKLNLRGASSSNSAVFVGGYLDYANDSAVTINNCSYDGTFRGNYVALVLSNCQYYSDNRILTISDLENKGSLIGSNGAYAVGGENHNNECNADVLSYYDEVQKTTGGTYSIVSNSVTVSVNDEGKIVISNPSEYTYTVSLYAGREIYDSNNHKWASNYNYAINFGSTSADVYRYQFVDYDTAIAECLIEASDCSDEWIPTNCEFAGDGKYQIVTKGLDKYYVLKFTTDDNLYAKFVIDLQIPTVMVCAYDSSNNLVGLTEL